MRAFKIAAGLLALGCGSAWGQTPVGPGAAPGGSTPFVATGSTAFRSSAARAADVVNVKDFGAIGDDIADDTASINAAFNHLRSLVVNGVLSAKLVFPHGQYKISGTGINGTGLADFSVIVEGDGATIDCQATGYACLDLMGDRYLTVRDLSILGSQTNTPKFGIQLGRVSSTALDNNTLDNVFVNGWFSTASVYDFSSETSLFSRLRAWNSSPNAYGLVMDGLNHFNITSAFVTISASVDVGLSFNEPTCVSCDIREYGNGGSGIWMSGPSRASFITSYVAVTAGTYGVVFYSSNTEPAFSNLTFDVHLEASTLPYDFLFTGPNLTPVLWGFHYSNHSDSAVNSVVKADAGLTNVFLRDALIDIGSFWNAGATVFDQPAIYTVSGNYASPVSSHWNLPAANFTGGYQSGDTRVWQGGLSTPGTAFLGAGSVAVGSDVGNGNIELGVASTSATPYIDFLGNGVASGHSARIVSNNTGQIALYGAGTGSNPGVVLWMPSGRAIIQTFQGDGNPPVLTSCGTGASVTGSNAAGDITEGTSATGCIVTFATTYLSAPHCTVTSSNGATLTGYSTSTSAITITNPSASGNKYAYTCIM